MLEGRANAGVAHVTPAHCWDISPNTQTVTRGQRRTTKSGRAGYGGEPEVRSQAAGEAARGGDAACASNITIPGGAFLPPGTLNPRGRR